jgi:hypothetical protein
MLVSLLSLALVAGGDDGGACEKEREAAFGSCVAACESLPVGKELAECYAACEAKDAEAACDGPIAVKSESLVDAEAIRNAAAAACHAPTTCPEPKSCAGWSAWYNCGDPFCGVVRWCGEDCEPDPRFCFGPGLRQPRERFRVCFSNTGTQCIEYQRSAIIVGCGC